jgi:hypothetical protein
MAAGVSPSQLKQLDRHASSTPRRLSRGRQSVQRQHFKRRSINEPKVSELASGAALLSSIGTSFDPPARDRRNGLNTPINRDPTSAAAHLLTMSSPSLMGGPKGCGRPRRERPDRPSNPLQAINRDRNGFKPRVAPIYNKIADQLFSPLGCIQLLSFSLSLAPCVPLSWMHPSRSNRKHVHLTAW